MNVFEIIKKLKPAINYRKPSKYHWKRCLVYVWVVGAMGLMSCQRGEQSARKVDDNRLTIFHAGSLTVPLRAIAKAFNEEHPEYDIVTEAAGSRESARKISELHKQCDLMISADYRVINDILIPEYAKWNIGFATNEMVLAYSRKSKQQDHVNHENWTELLQRRGVKLGRSEPESDPCGYRTVLTLKLAEIHYGIPGLSEQLLLNSIQYIRPKETDLLALLETGVVDYIFIYRSVAEQHQLGYVILPNEINLKEPSMKDTYEKVFIKLKGKAPGEYIETHGEPMVYGLTIPLNAKNPELAILFLTYFLNPEKGMRILEQMGQPPIIPCVFDFRSDIPEPLQKFLYP